MSFFAPWRFDTLVVVRVLYAVVLLASACGRIGFAEEGEQTGDDTRRSGFTLGSLSRVERIANVEVGSDIHGLLVAGTRLYAATSRAGAELVVFDIRDPANPIEIGTTSTAGIPYGLDIVGSRLYVTTETGGDDLEIFDVSTPNPRKLGGISAADSAYRVRVQDNRAYVTSASAGDDFEIFDVANPDAPRKLGGLDLLSGYYVRGVDVAYPLAFTAGQEMNVIDVSNPAVPVVLGSGDFYWYAYDLQVVGTRAVGLDSNNSNAPQLRVWDVSTPSDPVMIGMADIWDSYGRDVEVSSTFAITVCAPGGYSFGSELEIWDISGPTDPVLVTSAHLEHDGHALAAGGTHLFIGQNASADAELLVYAAIP